MTIQALINARLLDPATHTDTLGGVLIEKGKILDWGAHIKKDALPDGAKVEDCKGYCLSPGLVDAHAYLCEPGKEHRETMATAGMAAAAGGVTTINAFPATEPVIDDPAIVEMVMRRAKNTCAVNVCITGALTKGLQGAEMAEFGLLAEAGAVAFSDGQFAIENINLMRRALAYSCMFERPVIVHAEDPGLAAGGVMTGGRTATFMGLKSVPTCAEAILVERDIRLVKMTGARWHAAHLSTKDALDTMRRAKNDGLNVTAGTAPHYHALNDLELGEYRTFARVSPPLREEDERLAVIEGIKDGTIDIISSQHLPQSADSKRVPFAQAKPGVIGLETMLPVSLRLYHNGDVDLLRLLYTMTVAPAKLLGLEAGALKKGAAADLTLFDTEKPWQVDGDRLLSKSKNTAFDGHLLQGLVVKTFVRGKAVFER
ncbi:amidohydrolase family protein [Sneathiella chungangensis]|uniref:Amidohydrolase family protein n=1 Tax=Sneathiella chungangensis TaxID=1418234 RepID=A0A845MD22_9PROT|nr:dihydroorotase [Sneathiella chungangensis]MZR21561.1 amidohydrolase family protein [Sneathiella chungangensis]